MRRVCTSAACSVAIALGFASCGGSSGGNGGSGNGISSKSPDQIFTAVNSAVDGVNSVHVAGTLNSGGSNTTLDLNLVNGKGGQGSMSQAGLGFKIVAVGNNVYINGSNAFWRKFGGNAAVQLFSGKWLKAPATGQLSSIADLTNVRTLFSQLLSEPRQAREGIDIDGQRPEGDRAEGHGERRDAVRRHERQAVPDRGHQEPARTAVRSRSITSTRRSRCRRPRTRSTSRSFSSAAGSRGPGDHVREVLWRAEEHEPVTERAWDPARALDAIRAIVADAEAAEEDGAWPGHPLDDVREDEPFASLYLGSAGMVWGLARLGSLLDPGAVLASALARYRTTPDEGADAHAPSLFVGEAGVLVVADKLGAPVGDRSRLSELVRANREHPTWELLLGSPGTILAARACGLEDEWRESAERLYAEWDQSSNLWTQNLYGRVERCLGPVHGFAGNVHALRGFVEEEVLRARVARLLTRTARREDGLVNWPPTDRPVAELASSIRVQWCHGAPGIITTLGDLMPLELAIGGGELTWHAGPLRKGSGLCHGTAGNGFALLKLHDLTGDPLWLERARRFAMHAIEQVDAARAELGRGRYALMTGDIGVALYLRACLDAVAEFPIMDEL